jgi:diadenosine tetraphosphate (Ap4A) HIT family hydrolase
VFEQCPSSCPFARSAVEPTTFAKSTGFIAAGNLWPIVRGHALVLPCRHVEDVFELEPEELSALATFARRVTWLLVNYLEVPAFDWAMQQGRAAGQTVPHLHLHIVPRQAQDLEEGRDWYDLLEERALREPDAQAARALAKELRTPAASLGLWR